MTRYGANKEILSILDNVVENNPDLRFNQILNYVNLVNNLNAVEFYTESEVILDMLKTLSGEQSTDRG